jgi:hypothetical protein
MNILRGIPNKNEVTKILELYEVLDYDFYELDDKIEGIVEENPEIKNLHKVLVRYLNELLKQQG